MVRTNHDILIKPLSSWFQHQRINHQLWRILSWMVFRRFIELSSQNVASWSCFLETGHRWLFISIGAKLAKKVRLLLTDYGLFHALFNGQNLFSSPIMYFTTRVQITIIMKSFASNTIWSPPTTAEHPLSTYCHFITLSTSKPTFVNS